MTPSVLLLVVDALRADRVLGENRACRTPNLDEFRESATTFTRAFSVASTTTPCVASILTGTYPFVHGVHSLAGRRLRADLPTLPELFKWNGYRTWAETTGPLQPMTGLDRGFDEYRCRPPEQWLDTPFGDELVARLTSTQEPWFGYVHLWEVHNPRRVTSGFNHSAYGATLYDRAVSSLDNQLGRVLDAIPDDTLVVFTADHGEYLSPSRRKEWVTRLKGPAAWAKRNVPGVKRLRRWLMPHLFRGLRAGTPTDTDGYRAWLGHGFHVYDTLVHVPLLVRGADSGFPAGTVVEPLVSHVDVFPTLASALGLDGALPAHLSGLDLTALGRNGAAAAREALYLEANGARRMDHPEQWLAGLRTERYKYARGMHNPDLPVELYDLELNPEESENVAVDRPEITAELAARLSELMQVDVDAEPTPETAYTPEEEALLEARLRDLGYLD
ncbi:MAG TPA: sulfatase [Gaiellaceae bacterium]